MVSTPDGTEIDASTDLGDARSRKRRNLLVLGALSFCILVPFMDLSIVSVALTAIGKDLHASTAQLQWFLSGYMLSSALFMLIVPVIGDRFGYRLILLVGLSFFGVVSVLGIVGRNPGLFIATRILMGIGAATVLPMIMSAVMLLFRDGAKLAAATGTAVTIVGIINPIGPIVAGILIDDVSWSWIFAINILMVVTVIPLSIWLIPESKGARPQNVDIASIALLSIGLISIVYGAIEMPDDVRVSAILLVAGITVLVVFAFRQKYAVCPLIPFELFSAPRYIWAQLMLLAGSFGIYAMLFGMPMYLQEVLHIDATFVGIWLVPAAVCAGIGTKIGQLLAKKIDARWIVAIGLVVCAVGLVAALGVSSRAGLALVVFMFACTFLGGAIPQASALAAATAELPATLSADRAAFINSFRHAGGALGVAVMGSLEAMAYKAYLPRGAPDMLKQSVAGISYLPGSSKLGPVAITAFTHGVKVSMGWTAVAVAAVAVMACILPNRKTLAADSAASQRN